MELQRAAICLKFRPNQFNRNRCQTCFRSRDAHTEEALQGSKMNRKISKCGFLYVAPEGVDFSNSIHRSRRWQRRWFALYDDGELSYALDQHADTVPQGVVDMTTVTEVKEAEDVTGHSHSLRVTTQSNDHYYFKADTAEEIKWWRDLLCIYSKQLVRRKMRLNNSANGNHEEPRQANGDQADSGPTLVQVKNSPFKDRSQRRTSDPLSQAKVDITRANESSFHGTPRSVKNRKTTRYRDDVRCKTFSEFDTSGIIGDNSGAVEPSAVARVSEDYEDEELPRSDEVSSSWTVRLRMAKTGATNVCKTIASAVQGGRTSVEGGIGNGRTTLERTERRDPKEASPVLSSEPTRSSSNGRISSSAVLAPLEYKSIADSREDTKENNTVMAHTLRKGWLLLKGRSENDWMKHWVVLAGLSLKMYKDAWAEDGCADATVKIDLSDCMSVHPLSAARNYGIEIKCKHARYVLSALTPGIRDSWIAAMQQNLTATALENNNQVSCTNPMSRLDQTKKKRIAYVAPESHRRDTTCDMDGDAEDDDDMESFRSNSRADELSISGRSIESSIHDLRSDDGESATYSGASTPRRRRSLSPTVRRSPVSRIKERDTTRRQRSPAQLRTRSPSDNRSNTPSLTASNGASREPVLVHSEIIFDSRNLSTESARAEVNVIAMLQNQLETVRQELERTRGRLGETESENERLRVVTNGDYREASRNGFGAVQSAAIGDSEAELDRLRRTLQEAERDIWSKQEEIEVLTRKLDTSVNELSDTETVLSSNLQDLDSERAKFSSLSDDWSRRVNAMEMQLRETIRRLDERERELMNGKSSDHQKSKELSQRQRLGAAASETTIAELESKLAESEATVAALTRKLHASESARTNGETVPSASSAFFKAEDQEDGSKKVMVNDDGENEIRFDSLRHYCHDQNRRLLATLRNETEFLQTMVETKLAALGASNRASIVVELRELSDDLVAVHQYISDIDRHTQPLERLSPNDFMKDFNFKDVLNRLVEVQERFASLTKRDDTMSMVSEATICLASQSAVTARKPNSMHDSNGGPISFPLSSTNQTLEPAVPFSTYWDYAASAVHADLARSLASYLERKYDDSTQCTVLTSDDFMAILTETMALEACLLTEIANVIEASKNEERLRLAVRLRDVRNSYVVLRRLDDFLNDAGDDRRILALLEHRFDINFFNIFTEETKHFISAQFKELITTLPSNWKEKLKFGPADTEARTAALRALAKNLLRNSVVFDSNNEETTSCSMDLLRSTILKDEITHILARVETNLDTFDADSPVWNRSSTESLITEAVKLTLLLSDQLLEKIDRLIAEFKTGDRRCYAEDEKVVEAVGNRVTNFLNTLKQANSATYAIPLNASGAKMSHIDAAFIKEIEGIGSVITTQNYRSIVTDHNQDPKSDMSMLASLVSSKAIVRGYRSWIEATYGSGIIISTPMKVFDLRQSPADSEFRQFLASGSKLDECIAHYEPLTKQLFYRIMSNIGAKLVAVQLSVFYEGRMRDMAAAQESLLQRALRDQKSEWCGNRQEDGQLEKATDHPEARLRSKEELEHWRRLAPSDGSCGAPTNLAGEVAELEQEILEMQSYHSEEVDALRNIHTAEIESLKRELTNEQERRRKLYSDMESMKAVTDHSLATLERAHSQIVEQIRDEHRREFQRLEIEYERSLKEEKEATRQALDALQKAHEMELRMQAEKFKNTWTNRYSNENEDESGQSSRRDLQEALQEISKELSGVSAAYSAKCLENSRMEDELEDAKRMLDQMANGGAFSEEQMKQQMETVINRSAQVNALQAELNVRDTKIRCYEERIHRLESELSQTNISLASFKHSEKSAGSIGASVGITKCSTVPSVPTLNGHGEGISGSSANSEESEDEEDDIAAEYQPKVARRRRGLPTNRRGDSRYHSTPNLGSRGVGDSQQIESRLGQGLTPDRILQELRNVMGLPVSERRKYFEDLCRPII